MCTHRFEGSKPPLEAAIWKSDTVALLGACPYLVKVVATNAHEGDPTIQMEHEAGSSLYECLVKLPALTREEKDRVIQDVLAALDYLHRNGRVHRELDLRAVMLFFEGGKLQRAKLTNFASVAPHHPQAPRAKAPFKSVLQPPYVLDRNWLDQRDDLYACALVIHQLVTWNCRVYKSPEDPQAIQNEVNEAKDELGEPLAGIVGRFLSREREHLSAAAALQQLSAAQSGTALPGASNATSPLPAPRSGTSSAPAAVGGTLPGRKVSPLMAAVGGAVVATGLLLGSWLLLAPDSHEAPQPQHQPEPEPKPEPPPSDALPTFGEESSVLWKATTGEWVGWIGERCPVESQDVNIVKDNKRCKTTSDDLLWQRNVDRECLQERIAELNCKALKTKNEIPVLTVVYFGILTGLSSDSYTSTFHQLRGLYAIQSGTKDGFIDNVRIRLILANGGQLQKHAKEVLQRMRAAGVKVDAVIGFSDSTRHTDDAVKEACDKGIIALGPTLSANAMADDNDCFVSLIPLNDVEARLFYQYAKSGDFSRVVIYRNVGKSLQDSEEDLYIVSLVEHAKRLFTDDEKTFGVPVVRDYHPSDSQHESTGIRDDMCPIGETLVIYAGRHTAYVDFLTALRKRCGKRVKATNIIADDSASRVDLKTRETGLAELIRRIPVVVKSFEVKRSDLQRSCPGLIGQCSDDLVLNGLVARDSLLFASGMELFRQLANTKPRRSSLLELFKSRIKDPATENEINGVAMGRYLSEEELRTMRKNNDLKFFKNGKHYSPLNAPIMLVQRKADGEDKLLCGCAYVEHESTPELRCSESCAALE